MRKNYLAILSEVVSELDNPDSTKPHKEVCKQALLKVHEGMELDACFLFTSSQDSPDRLRVLSSTADKLTPFRTVEFDADAPFALAVAERTSVPWEPLQRNSHTTDPLWELTWQAMHLGPYAGPWEVAACALKQPNQPDVAGMLIFIKSSDGDKWTEEVRSFMQALAYQFNMAIRLHNALGEANLWRTNADSKLMEALLQGGRAVVMHGVLAPLQTIEVHVELAKQSLKSGDTRSITHSLDTIRAMSIEATSVGKNFLLLAKNSAPDESSPASRPPASEWVNVLTSFAEMERSLGPLARLTSKTFVARIADPVTFPMLKRDLDEILSNLLHNAIKYGHRATKIKITLHHKARHSNLDVTSYGIPISKEDSGRIFHLGYRTREAIAVHFNAVGMGLYQAETLAKRAGAELFLAASEPVLDDTTGTRQYRSTFRLRAKR